MNHPQAVISAYLDGAVTSQQVDELAAWIGADSKNADAFALQALVHRQAYELFHENQMKQSLAGELTLSPVLSDSFIETLSTLTMDEQKQSTALVDISDEMLRRENEQQAERSDGLELPNQILATQSPVKPVRHYVIPKSVFYGAIATVAAMLIVLILPMFESKPVIENLDAAPQLIQVAVLVEQVDAKWLGISTSGGAPGGHSPALGDAILNQPMHLTSGLVKIRFNNEAEVILEAPCSIEPISGGEIKITHGKLVGRCETTASKGFVVHTPGAQIIDMGTEFGVSVDQQGIAQAHVFEGEIELTTASITSPIKIQQDQARQIDSIGARVSTIKTDELYFVRGEEFEANAKADESPYHRWLAHSYKLRRDPNLVAYYTFDNQSESPNQLLNRAAATLDELDGRLESDSGVGPRRTVDRFGRPIQALRFNADERDQVRVNHHPALNFDHAVSIAVWVNVSDPRINHHLLTKRVYPRDGQLNADAVNFVWVGDWSSSPTARNYSILFHTHHVEQWIDYETDSILKDQTGWAHLAVTYDQNERVYYLNGRQVSRIADNTPIQHNTAPMLIGGVSYTGHRHFDGVMDELAIFNEALSEQDIREIYEAGKP